MSALVRPLHVDDRTSWEAVWASYLEFYETDLPDEVTDDLFRRLLDPTNQVTGLVAESEGRVVGLAHVVVGPNTWSLRDDGYLEDLGVLPSHRGTGVGRALLEAVVAMGRDQHWRRIHWLTDRGNQRARHLYDKLAEVSPYVRYAIDLEG